jgi:hypothetical protein
MFRGSEVQGFRGSGFKVQRFKVQRFRVNVKSEPLILATQIGSFASGCKFNL